MLKKSKLLRDGLLAAPFVLAGLAITGGHVSANQVQNQNAGQKTVSQNTGNQPANIKK